MVIDKNAIGRVEEDITPPMKRAITLPILYNDGSESGIVIYMASSPFGDSIPERTLRIVAGLLTITNQ